MESFELKFLRIFDTGRYCNLLKLADGKLLSEDGYTFPIHRMTLATNSDYFRAMFCDFGEEDRREFQIPGIKGESLSEILCYIYTGDIALTECNITEHLLSSDYLLLTDLHREIAKRAKDHIALSNCLKLYDALNQTDAEKFSEECFRFIQIQFETISRDQKCQLADLSLEVLIKILSNGSLYVYDESTVWLTIVEWTRKDMSARLSCVPRLLISLAGYELDEKLATEICQHQIVTTNPFLEDLSEMISSKAIANNLDIILHFLQNHDSCKYRIPPHLHVIAVKTGPDVSPNIAMYITYDENLDLWRKIAEIDFFPDFIITVGHNIYAFCTYDRTCANFDLSIQEWVPMRNFRYSYHHISVLEIDGNIYVLGGRFSDIEMYSLEIYDTSTDSWSDGIPLPNFRYGIAATILKKIYLVGAFGIDDPLTTVAMVFDVTTREWSSLPAPNVSSSIHILVALHEKLYIIGNSQYGSSSYPPSYSLSLHVFDPSINMWTALAKLPHAYTYPSALVLNNQMIVFEDIAENSAGNIYARWNDQQQCWEPTTYFRDLFDHAFCTVEDVDTVRIITRENRDRGTKLEKIHFN